MVFSERRWEGQLERDEKVAKSVGVVVGDWGGAYGAGNAWDVVGVGVGVDERKGMIRRTEALCADGSGLLPPCRVVGLVPGGCMEHNGIEVVPRRPDGNQETPGIGMRNERVLG